MIRRPRRVRARRAAIQRARRLDRIAMICTAIVAASVVVGLFTAFVLRGGENQAQPAFPRTQTAAATASATPPTVPAAEVDQATSPADDDASDVVAGSAAQEPVSPGPTEPPAIDIPDAGSGRWVYARTAIGPSVAEGRSLKLAVRVEDSLSLDVEEVAKFAMATLQDQRGWQGIDGVAFELVSDESAARHVISIASPDTVDRLCAPLKTFGELSCRNGRHVALNVRRWLLGAEGFDDVVGYRQYLVNHEVGHALGHGHVECPGAGRAAPVMQQQSKGLDGCAPNAWPSIA